MNDTFADKAINYFTNIKTPVNLPIPVEVMNPYEKEEVKDVVRKFYYKFFNDTNKRIYVLGINPGRFGGGLTGLSFTDPSALKTYCGIENNLGTQAELSSRYVYKFINEFGGAERFFSRFYLSALYPLAIIKDGKNYNFYDDKELLGIIKPGIISSVRQQVEFGAERNAVICFGRKNEKYLNEINSEYHFFDRIITLDHPRYIMQYKLKSVDTYIDKYISVFNSLQ
jgi:hypothetical protein